MPKKSEFVDFVLEQLTGVEDVNARAMFGGYGIYGGEVMFALIADGALYFKADEQTRDQFIERGLQPFTYEARGKSIALQYYAAPPEVFDEQEAMVDWARRGLEAALRAPAKKTRKRRK
jgi:DNA transformation protein and related proteins